MALKKSRTFQGPANPPAPGEMFPTSPQPISGDGLVHWGHPKHPLVQLNVADRFTCAGCKECGAGKRFVCPYCDYQLHHFCANAPATLNSHSLHCHHTLVLFSKPAQGGGSKCELCHKECKGYAFRCNACVFQLHPCCATLGPEIRLAQLHPHTLRLLPTEAAAAALPCAECGRKRLGLVYHCTDCVYHVHAVCAKSAVIGLRENDFKDQKPSNVLNSAVRLTSRVVIVFIGRLMNGIAEGVGEVIVQDALKGRSTSPSSSAAKSSSKNTCSQTYEEKKATPY